MNKIQHIFFTAAAVLALVSCEKEVVKTTIPSADRFTGPTLSELSDVIVDANNNKVEAVVFTWTPADMGVQTQIDYSLYVSYTGADGAAHEALLGTTPSLSLTVSKNDFNSLAVTDLAIPRNETGTLKAWVVATILGLNAGTVRSTNDITFDFTTFDPPKDWIFLPGYYNSWGDSNDKEEWRVWEVEGGTGIYRTVVKLAEDATNTPGICPLKLYMDGSWLGGADGYEATWEGWDYGDKDGNWGVPASEPINIIEFSKAKKTASRTPVSGVGLIGDFAPSNWGSDVFFDYDATKNVWVSPAVTFEAGKGFLIRLNESWDAKFKYGGATKKSDAVEDGFELENDGNAANITIPEAGTWVMKIYFNRTPAVLVMEKQ